MSVVVFGVLVVYSESYLKSAVSEFNQLLKDISEDSYLVVVSNNQDINCLNQDGIHFMRWTNYLGEFGAWQAGVDYLTNNFCKEKLSGSIVFANDTFCHHRKFGSIERFFFCQAIKKTFVNKPLVAGDINFSKYTYKLESVDLNFWISTYLFAINIPALVSLNWRITPSEKNIDEYVPFEFNGTSIFGERLDNNLREHIKNWLFGKDKANSWYKAGDLTLENAKMYSSKARSIVCEKVLSASLLKNNVEFTPVFSKKINIFRKIMAIFNI